MKIIENNTLKKRLFINLTNEYLGKKLDFLDLCEIFNETPQNLLKMTLNDFNTMLLSYIHNRTMGLKKC